ncbi:MAG: NAD-dependent epimerase/dehydratase family protein [Myxococcota bacterium]
MTITGGAGYVGSSLVPWLLARGWRVTVLDRMVYGNCLPVSDPGLRVITGDVRDPAAVRRAVAGQQAVIHLAFVSNDPEYRLPTAIGDAINREAFPPLVRICREEGVGRFLFLSSCSVYGARAAGESEELDETSPVQPLTAYARMKHECESFLRDASGDSLCATTLRPATLCGRSPRQRLDLTVNKMVMSAYLRGRIVLRNPDRTRPSLHLHDLLRICEKLLAAPPGRVAGQTFNAAFENCSLRDLAGMVRAVAGGQVRIAEEAGGDGRSYRVSSEKLARAIAFKPAKGVADAARELIGAFKSGALPEAETSPRYHNLKAQLAHDWSLHGNRPA